VRTHSYSHMARLQPTNRAGPPHRSPTFSFYPHLHLTRSTTVKKKIPFSFPLWAEPLRDRGHLFLQGTVSNFFISRTMNLAPRSTVQQHIWVGNVSLCTHTSHDTHLPSPHSDKISQLYDGHGSFPLNEFSHVHYTGLSVEGSLQDSRCADLFPLEVLYLL